MSLAELPTRRSAAASIEKLKRHLRGVGQVMEPTEAEEPILAAPVRRAVFGWLAEINARDELNAVGIKPRVSALLSGPPGCGKTTLAHHLAARLGIPMVNVGAENLLSSALGASESNVARLFDGIAESDTPCVLFLDEIDAVGGKRRDTSGDRGGAVGAMNSVLTVILRKVEAFSGLMIAATNRPDTLDPALWRRFGMQIEVLLPDDDARFAILKRYGLPFVFDDATLDLLTDLTEGASPSLLRQLMEGLKRLIVLGDRMGNLPASLPIAIAAITAQTTPPPDMDRPALWLEAPPLAQLESVAWPPARQEAL